MKYQALVKRLKESRLFKDSFWALAGSVIGKALSLFAGIIVARFLGKELYGEYGMIKSTLINISVFSTLGLGYTGTRFIAKYMQENPNMILLIIKRVYQITISFSGFVMLLIFLFAKEIAAYMEVGETDDAFRIAALIVLMNAINTAQLGLLSGFKAFKVTAINGMIVGIVTFLLSTIFTYLWGLNGSLIALLCSQFIGVVLNAISVYKKKILYNDSGSCQEVTKELLLFSIPVAMQEFLYTVVVWMTSLLMVKYSNYGEVGLIGVVSQWVSIILFVPSVLKNVALSYFSSDSNQSLYKRMLQLNLVATLIPYICIVLSSPFIVSLYGSKFQGLTCVLLIGTLQPIFTSLSTVIVYEFIAKGKTWFMFWARLIRESASLILVWIALNIFSSNEAVIVSGIHVVVAIIFLFAMFFFSQRNNTNEGNAM